MTPGNGKLAGLWSRWQRTAKGLRRDVYALWLASRDRRTPWQARAIMALVVAYPLSPINLIPNFIPVLGQLDDLIVVWLGILLAKKIVPPEVMEEARIEAESRMVTQRSALGLAIVLAIWLAVSVVLALVVYQHL